MALFSTPSWVHHAIFYQIFPDRFARSQNLPKPNNLEPWEAPPTPRGFKGGDLFGVIEHLDYLQDLGATAIYFNPIFQSAANHRYHTHDYYQVDPLLGGNVALTELIKAAHQRSIRVILDGVFNHASRGFFQFNHILENEAASPYLDWFRVHGFPLNAYHGRPNYDGWWNLAALPQFNHTNPQVRQFIFDVTRFWLEQGIDGWRLDVPFEIKADGFWQEFRQIVKGINPEAYIVGEVPWEAHSWLQGDQFDGVMNYQLMQACLGFFSNGDINRAQESGMMGLPETPTLDAAAFSRRVNELFTMYPIPAVLAQLNLLSSHDMPRFLTLVNGDKTALRLATLFQMTCPGAPCIYYGDEIGMQGGKDPDCRGVFPWDVSAWDHDLRDDFKRFISMRRAHPALRDGVFNIVYAHGSTLLYLRDNGKETLLIAIQLANEQAKVEALNLDYIHASTPVRRILGRGQLELHNGLRVNLPPRSGTVWQFKIRGTS